MSLFTELSTPVTGSYKQPLGLWVFCSLPKHIAQLY